ncbi:Asparagine-linked glycosylation protein 11 [Wickerhamomyces ciferrii]|uniref:GDP-Man:Man(3)GlcNAc(2)-PP-Dol alpha-1,2-mannosyltransferase n=1 Tax=Wickerhamomyces ciferrii (strain ATCC 14091 / BCRC 22168 / CBS 111 / JCM 3599 / NBRC 0793 / NRRL Y-1031 F-60-10) TaxID=1206466 RepID=K0KQP2_WICCF|nr:Asparagine-linked glycosylation protein 11 [Wickerhamomyces ciferrii]CCH43664.1 Asparagine-linked glycosylation protein 11 [Wickerhamomyces ciferrii]
MSSGKTFGYFHPYCNAGGGGERVLWQAVEATLNNNRSNKVVIYTGDIDSSSDEIVFNVNKRFNIDLSKVQNNRLKFIFLNNRSLVDPKTWPILTLLGQAIGSIILAYEAATKFKPDVWVETMGYPFTYLLIHYLLGVPILTYTHYPVISKDMLGKLNPSFTSIYGLKQIIKYIYWQIFMFIYTIAGYYADIATTNSTWTFNHIKSIWWKNKDISIIYPPCSTENFVKLDDGSSWNRENTIVSVAQFRPEKRHGLILQEYSIFLQTITNLSKAPKLVLIGSIRGKSDEDYVKDLQKQANDLKIPKSHIEFILDAKYEVIQQYLQKSSFGLNAMWNEHFGIAVVEYVASGLVPLVHASAGPLLDIVVPWDSKLQKQSDHNSINNRTGFFFKDKTDPDFNNLNDQSKYPSLSEVFIEVSSLTNDEKLQITKRGKECVLTKFSDQTFDLKWIEAIGKIEKIPKTSPKLNFLILGIVFFVGLIVSIVKGIKN